MRATGPAPVDGACGRLRPEAATEIGRGGRTATDREDEGGGVSVGEPRAEKVAVVEEV
ncbi:uncharacterized protein METZ01_LOCUS114185, partial [marine metagenome]